MVAGVCVVTVGGCALACRSGWAGHSWIRRAEPRQLGWDLAGGGKPASHVVRSGGCDFVTQRPHLVRAYLLSL